MKKLFLMFMVFCTSVLTSWAVDPPQTLTKEPKRTMVDGNLVETPVSGTYTLKWKDDFTTLNEEVWNIEVTGNGGGNQELQYYCRKGVSVSGGNLVLTATRENYAGKSFTSGRINSQSKIFFKYGKIEARIKLPKTYKGLWPAFWMMGNDYPTVGWPRCGELDILEMGNVTGWTLTPEETTAGLTEREKSERFLNGACHWHWGGGQADEGGAGHFAHNKVPVSVQDGNYWIFGCDWSENGMICYVRNDDDSQHYEYFAMGQPDDHSFMHDNFILFNLAVGGSLFPQITDPNLITAVGAENGSSEQMLVDYVAVYQDENDPNSSFTDNHHSTSGEASAEAHNFTGDRYYLIDFNDEEIIAEQLAGKEIIDWRVNDNTRHLYIWDNNWAAGSNTGTNIYGHASAFQSYTAQADYAGLGYAYDQPNDLSGFTNEYKLHLDVKTSEVPWFTLTFAGKTLKVGDGQSFDVLINDGQWHSLDIPVSAFGLDYSSMKSFTGNMFAIESEAGANTTLQYGSVFVYGPSNNNGMTLSASPTLVYSGGTSLLTLTKGSSVLTPDSWTVSPSNIGTIVNGEFTGLKSGNALITAHYGSYTATASVDVFKNADEISSSTTPHSFDAEKYYVVNLDATNVATINDKMVDLRVDDTNVALYNWDYGFTSMNGGSGTNIYGAEGGYNDFVCERNGYNSGAYTIISAKNLSGIDDTYTFHIDVKLPQTGYLRLGIKGASVKIGAAETNDIVVTANQWTSIDIPVTYLNTKAVYFTGENAYTGNFVTIETIDAAQGNVFSLGGIFFYGNDNGSDDDDPEPSYEIAAAPVPAYASEDVLSVYSNKYTAAVSGLTKGNWSQSTNHAQIATSAIDYATKLTSFNYTGFEWTGAIDGTTYGKMHLDVYPTSALAADATIWLVDDNGEECQAPYNAADLNQWNSVDIVLSEMTVQSGNTFAWNDIRKMGINGGNGNNTVYLDNIYFYKADAVLPDVTAPTVVLGEPTATANSISFTVTATDDSAPITITVKNGGETVKTISDIPSGEAQTVTIEGLTAETAYTFSVTATDNGSNTSVAKTVTATTLAAPAADLIEPHVLTSGDHTINVYPKDNGNGTYTLVIKSDEVMSGMGGSFWSTSNGNADMRTNLQIQDGGKTMVITVESTSEPQPYTFLYILMPGEVTFAQPTLNWQVGEIPGDVDPDPEPEPEPTGIVVPVPTRNASNVTAVYTSGTYAGDKTLTVASWAGAGATLAEYTDENGRKAIHATNTKFIGYDFDAVDVTDRTHLHVDIYPVDQETVSVGLTDGGDHNHTFTVTRNQWNSIDYVLSENNITANSLGEIKITKTANGQYGTEYDGSAELYLANIYFYKESDIVPSVYNQTVPTTTTKDPKVTANNGHGDIAFTWTTLDNGNVTITVSPVGDATYANYRGDGFNGKHGDGFTLNGSEDDFATYFDTEVSGNTYTLSLKDANNKPAVGSIIAYKGEIELETTGFTNDWSAFSFDRFEYGMVATGDPVPAAEYPIATASTGDANAAVDGNHVTLWTSTAGVTDPQWLMIDYRTPQHINTATIDWEGAYSKDFTIQVSNDGTNWETVATVTNNEPAIVDQHGIQEVDFTKTVDARYVKFESTRPREVEWGNKIYEFEVSYVEHVNVPVTGITLNKASATVMCGKTEKLTATLAPANATNKNVTWTSSDEAIATVVDGVVTVKSDATVGETVTITATTEDGGMTAQCFITVADNDIQAEWLDKVSGTTNAGLTYDIEYAITYNDDKTITVEVLSMDGTLFSEKNPDKQFNFADEWSNIVDNKVTSTKTFEEGAKPDMFFWFPYTGGVARVNVAYTVGGSHVPDVTAPTDFTAGIAAVADTYVTFNLKATDDASEDVTYTISYGAGQTKVVTGKSGQTTTYSIEGLTPETAYTFSVVASDDAGNKTAAQELNATTKSARGAASGPYQITNDDAHYTVQYYVQNLDGVVTISDVTIIKKDEAYPTPGHAISVERGIVDMADNGDGTYHYTVNQNYLPGDKVNGFFYLAYDGGADRHDFSIPVPENTGWDHMAPVVNKAEQKTATATPSSVTLTLQATDETSSKVDLLVYDGETLIQTIPAASGQEVEARIGGLMPARQYSFTVKARDIAGNVSATGQIVVATTGDYTLVWGDEFDSNTLGKNWNVEVNNSGGGNSELQYYTDREKNVTIENGNLVLTAIREDYGTGNDLRNFTSGRVTTQNNVTFTHGKVEARIKLPKTAKGLWPAFWMMGNDIEEVGWPKCGETDILEAGHQNGFGGNEETYFSGCLHWGEAWDQHGQWPGDYYSPYSIMDDEYHVFTCIWDEEWMKFYLDDAKEPYYSAAISKTIDPNIVSADYMHKPNFILFNLAVGGNFPGIYSEGGITALPTDGSEAKMYVDYVRVYQETNNVSFKETDSYTDHTAPTGLTATASETEPKLTVGATDDSGKVISYTVLNGTKAIAFGVSQSSGTTAIKLNGLTAGQSYTLTVVASDIDGNSAETTVDYTVPGTVAPTTALTPVHEQKNVVSIYSDKYLDPVVANYNAEWWKWPEMTETTPLADNHIMTYSGENMPVNEGVIGWQFSKVDASAMEYMHVDIWPATSGTISIEPISVQSLGDRSVNHSGKFTVQVEAGKWNSIDIPVSTLCEHDGMFDIADITQLQISGYHDQSQFSIDNVYFWYDESAARPVIAYAELLQTGTEKATFKVVTGKGTPGYTYEVYNGTVLEANKLESSLDGSFLKVSGLTGPKEYTLNIVATDAAGNKSLPKRVVFNTLSMGCQEILPSTPRGEIWNYDQPEAVVERYGWEWQLNTETVTHEEGSESYSYTLTDSTNEQWKAQFRKQLGYTEEDGKTVKITTFEDYTYDVKFRIVADVKDTEVDTKPINLTLKIESSGTENRDFDGGISLVGHLHGKVLQSEDLDDDPNTVTYDFIVKDINGVSVPGAILVVDLGGNAANTHVTLQNISVIEKAKVNAPAYIDGAYYIYDAEQLKIFADRINDGTYEQDATAYLMADIDMTSIPAGSYAGIGTAEKPFIGSFTSLVNPDDHNSLTEHTISMSGTTTGVFSNVAGSATITGIYTEGTVTSTGGNVGGVIDNATGNVTLNNVVNGADVSGTDNVGGVIGNVDGTATITLVNVLNEGTVKATAGSAAGLIADATATTVTARNVGNAGNVSGTTAAAFFNNITTTGSNVENAYNSGVLTGMVAHSNLYNVPQGQTGSVTLASVFDAVNRDVDDQADHTYTSEDVTDGDLLAALHTYDVAHAQTGVLPWVQTIGLDEHPVFIASTILTAKIKDVDANNATITLRGQDGSGTTIHYTIKDEYGNVWTTTGANGVDVDYQLTGLRNGTTYNLTVTAVNEVVIKDGEKPEYQPVGEPQKLKVVTPAENTLLTGSLVGTTNTTATLKMNSAGVDGMPVVYTITTTDPDDPSVKYTWTTTGVGGEDVTYPISGLKQGKDYTFNIKAKTETGVNVKPVEGVNVAATTLNYDFVTTGLLYAKNEPNDGKHDNNKDGNLLNHTFNHNSNAHDESRTDGNKPSVPFGSGENVGKTINEWPYTIGYTITKDEENGTLTIRGSIDSESAKITGMVYPTLWFSNSDNPGTDGNLVYDPNLGGLPTTGIFEYTINNETTNGKAIVEAYTEGVTKINYRFPFTNGGFINSGFVSTKEDRTELTLNAGISQTTNTTATLNMNAANGTTENITYTIYEGDVTGQDISDLTPVGTTIGTAGKTIEYVVTDLTPNTQYTYTVVANDGTDTKMQVVYPKTTYDAEPVDYENTVDGIANYVWLNGQSELDRKTLGYVYKYKLSIQGGKLVLNGALDPAAGSDENVANAVGLVMPHVYIIREQSETDKQMYVNSDRQANQGKPSEFTYTTNGDFAAGDVFTLNLKYEYNGTNGASFFVTAVQRFKVVGSEVYLYFDERAQNLAVTNGDNYNGSKYYTGTAARVYVHRPMPKSTNWYAFCMPFEMKKAKMLECFGLESDIRYLKDVHSFSPGDFTLRYAVIDELDGILKAGQPAIVLASETARSTQDFTMTRNDNYGDNIAINTTNENRVNMATTCPVIDYSDQYEFGFVGEFEKKQVPLNSYIISANKYYYVDTEMTMSGFRGYFTYIDKTTGQAADAKGFKLSFDFGDDDDDFSTGINGIESDNQDEDVFGLNGVKYDNSNVLPKGIYIINGRKVVK